MASAIRLISFAPSAPSEAEHAWNQERQARFRKVVAVEKAKATFPPSPKLPNLRDSLYLNRARKVCKYFGEATFPPEVTAYRGAMRQCLTSTEMPKVLFKKNIKGGEPMQDYLAVTKAARSICEQHSLTLLYVPPCEVLDRDILMEEFLEFFCREQNAIRSLYEWAIYDPELEPFMHERMRQLTILTCLLGWADLKPDNAPPMLDGRIALVDLDQRDRYHEPGILGLISSTSFFKDGGLFSFIPFKWFDETVALIKQHIPSWKMELLQPNLEGLRSQALERTKRIKAIDEFYASKGVTSPKQLIALDGLEKNTDFSIRSDLKALVLKIVYLVNYYIQNRIEQFTLTHGRQLMFNIGVYKSREETDEEFKNSFEEACIILRKNQSIFDFRLIPYCNSATESKYVAWFIF